MLANIHKVRHWIFATAAVVSIVACLAVIAAPSAAHAAFNPFADVCSNADAKTSAACQANGSDPISGGNGILNKVTLFIALVGGAAAVIVIVVAGIMYVASDGDPGRTKIARETIIFAIVGIIVILVARSIVVFVVSRV